MQRYCNPKIPEIEWTTVHTLEKRPLMLWNSVTLKKPVTGRFLRFVSPGGMCLFTEVEVAIAMPQGE